ncbi:MAG TPA: acetyl-CoA carboxylase biotin carboxyl carrier protein subunit [Bacteroidales bacterium]|nr:acetyl-CoA carboxylase biotin carboxyl carrier protein subunit [Bacteroidales bacterium]HPR58430.1 acetyl-CoA carboxylase biotin carboxyl carrier protein subunit [Bacteroidales bacterium]HRW96883.1 acetyl-CoA carboxylase biotin carboxyl carrier protein subunit [Bacteroidales bacterium]
MRTDLLEQRLKAASDEDTLAAGENKIFSPLPGRVFKINVKEGDAVSKGDILLVIDAMKMENNILAKKDATVKKILVALHDMVDSSAVLIELE